MALTNLMTAITLDVYDHTSTKTSIKSISCDSNTRFVRAALTYAHVPYKVSVNAAVALTVVRPDGAAVNIEGEAYNSESANTDRIVAELTDVATAVKGSLLAQFKIEDGNQVLRTEVFKIDNGVALDIDSDKWADTYQGYDLSELDKKITTVSTEFDKLRAAKISDIGKALVAKSVAGGKVTSWEFKDVSSGGGSDSGGEGGGSAMAVYYVTPEDYGAVGDGSTDDTNAVSQAFNSGMPVVLTQGKTYKIDTVTVTSPLIIIGNLATISTTASSTLKSAIIIRANAKTAIISDVNFTTTLGINTTGAHGETITNRSMRTCIASYGIEKLSVVNCNIENFDNGIIGMTESSDTAYASVLSNLYVKDTRITNTLMGISRHFRNAVVEGCSIVEDTNAQSGEHCLYFLTDVLENAYISDTTLITDGSSSGSCVQFYPKNGEADANLVDGVYKIDGCVLIGDSYVSVHGGGKCYVTASTLKTGTYNTTNLRRQFACPSNDSSFIDVTGCSINLELQDGLTEKVIYRGCSIYSNRVLSSRFALAKAYDCQFDNIGISVAQDAEIIGCTFSASVSVVGNYYVYVGSAITASTISKCLFNTGGNVGSIAYNSTGKCLLVAVISSLPNGNNNTGLTFYHKIDPTQSESGGTATGLSIVSGQLCVTYAE